MKTTQKLQIVILKRLFLSFNIKICILLLIIFGNLNPIKAQSVIPPTDCSLTKDSLDYYVEIGIPDTLLVSQIELGIGTAFNSNDVLSYIFEFDQSTGLPSGYSYLRNGTMVNLGIGEMDFSPLVYVQVRIKSLGNIWSDWYQFVSNK